MKCVIFILDTILNILYPRELIEMSIILLHVTLVY